MTIHARVDRIRRHLLALAALAVLVVGGSPLGPSPRAQAVPAALDLPAGRWETFASGNDVLALALDGETLWAGTRAGGLVRWDTARGTYTQFLRPQDPIAGNTVYDVAVGTDGRKWIATDQGLSVLDDGGTPEAADDEWRTYTRDATFGGLPSDDVRAVAVDGDLVWVGGFQVWDPDDEAWEGGGLGRLDTEGTLATNDDSWAPVFTFEGTLHEGPNGDQVLGLVSDNVTDIVVTPQGNLWLATAPHERFEKPPVSELPAEWTKVHGGISFLDTRGTATTADDVWTPTSCETMRVTVTCEVQTLALDHGGLMWAAIHGRGVMYWPVGETRIIDEDSRVFALPTGPADDYVDAIAFGPADDPALTDTVWLGRRKGGLSVLDHNGTARRSDDDEWDFGRGIPLTTADGLAADRVQAVTVANGTAWLGTGPDNGLAGGLSRLDIGALAFGAPLVTTNAPPTNFLTAVAFGEPGTRWDGHVWLGTGSRVQRRFGAGAVDLDTHGTTTRIDDAWTRYTAHTSDPDGEAPWEALAGDNIHAVTVQGDRVWFGSAEATWNQAALRWDDGGVAVFDGETWTARTVANTKLGGRAGLRHGSVSSLAVGCDGELWIGTGNGWSFWGAGVDVLTPDPTLHTLAGDRWEGHGPPQMAGANTTDIAVDCARRQVWVTAEHHVTQGDPQSGTAGGDWVGGGAAVFDLATKRWTRYTAGGGLECYARSFVECEATGVAVGRDGDVWVGTYGTRAMSNSALVDQYPYYPAVVNRRGPGAATWAPTVFEGDGQISGLAFDAAGRLYVGTTRDGAARASPRPEIWTTDRSRGGLLVHDGEGWHVLDMTTSGVPANDLSDVGVAPDGDVWVTTEGWGLARFTTREDAPTPTPTSDAPTPTASASPTASRTPTTAPPSATTAGSSTPAEPTPRGTGTVPTPPAGRRIYLPVTQRAQR